MKTPHLLLLTLTRSCPPMLCAAASLLSLMLFGLAGSGPLVTAATLSSAFTYSGRLTETGKPPTGNYDFQFSLYDAATGGGLVGSPTVITRAPVGVTGGVFTVTLDFGSATFAGDARWLEIAVRPNGSSAAYALLSPRQALTAMPYALFAPTAAAASSVPWSGLTGVPGGFADGVDNDTTYTAGGGLVLSGTTFALAPLGVTTPMLADNAVTAPKLATDAITASKVMSGQLVKSLNGLHDDVTLIAGENVVLSTLGSSVRISASALGSGDAWSLNGNSGTAPGFQFLGTTDPRPLELKVNSQRALRLEYSGSSINVLGGFADNLVVPGVTGGTISGGGRLGLGHVVIGDFGFIGGGLENSAGQLASVSGGQHNRALGTYSSIAGGTLNESDGIAATVSGGKGNSALSDYATVGGGLLNQASLSATVSGGASNLASGESALIGGGEGNVASGHYASVPGGRHNTAAGDYSFAGGNRASAIHDGAFVWADAPSFFGESEFASTAPTQFLIRARGGVGIGTSTPVEALDVRNGAGVSGEGGAIHIGGTRANGDPKLISFGDGDFVHVGENGRDDTLELKAARFSFVNGSVGIGTDLPSARLEVVGEARVQVLTITGGADVAEPFPLADPEIASGSLVVIDEARPGQLKLSQHAYDRQVAGIVSGANGIQPGLTLRQEGALAGGKNVALTGRVYAWADGSQGPIQPGDLLTTSDVPGHAMKASDPARAQGAVIGKAMSALPRGRGLVLVLVSLQ